MALNEWCFSKEVIGNKCKIIDGTRIHIDGLGHDIFCQTSSGVGKFVTAHWNGNGVLVVTDDKGYLHHYVGASHKFTAYNGDETYFTNTAEYKNALEECKQFRAEAGKNKQKVSKKSTSTTPKGPWWWRGIKWIFKGILKLVTFGVFVGLSKDDS